MLVCSFVGWLVGPPNAAGGRASDVGGWVVLVKLGVWVLGQSFFLLLRGWVYPVLGSRRLSPTDSVPSIQPWWWWERSLE